MYTKLYDLVPRIFFLMSFGVFALAIWKWAIELFGWTLTFLPYKSGRLIEFSGILLIFVIAFLLRQIREELRKK